MATTEQKPLPDISDLLRQRLRDALAGDWTGTEEELDAETDDLIDLARDRGRRLREARDGKQRTGGHQS